MLHVSRCAADLELPREGLDDARDFFSHAGQRRNDWKAIYVTATVTESQLRRDAEVHLHFMFHSRPNPAVLIPESAIYDIEQAHSLFGQWKDMPNLCVRLQRHPDLELRSATDKAAELIATHADDDYRDEAVLVGIVQLLKKEKGAMPSPVPSLIWLKRLDTRPKPLLDTLENIQRNAFFGGLIPSPEGAVRPASLFWTFPVTNPTYREGGVCIGLTNSIAVQTGELPSKHVKRRAEVVRNFPNQHAPVNRGVERAILNAKIVVTALSVELGYDNTIGMFCEESLRSILQGYELAMCPHDLGARPIQIVHSGQTIPKREPVSQPKTGSHAP
jgi:hypothetical protein